MMYPIEIGSEERIGSLGSWSEDGIMATLVLERGSVDRGGTRFGGRDDWNGGALLEGAAALERWPVPAGGERPARPGQHPPHPPPSPPTPSIQAGRRRPVRDPPRVADALGIRLLVADCFTDRPGERTEVPARNPWGTASLRRPAGTGRRPSPGPPGAGREPRRRRCARACAWPRDGGPVPEPCCAWGATVPWQDFCLGAFGRGPPCRGQGLRLGAGTAVP
jgi:hypothetical protein